MSCFQLCQIKRQSKSWDLGACLEGAWQAAPPHQLLITQLSRSCGKHKTHTAERSYSYNAVECRSLGVDTQRPLSLLKSSCPNPPGMSCDSSPSPGVCPGRCRDPAGPDFCAEGLKTTFRTVDIE